MVDHRGGVVVGLRTALSTASGDVRRRFLYADGRSRRSSRRPDDKRSGRDDDWAMSTTEIRAHLMELAQERITAQRLGLSADGAYMADLQEEIAIYRSALTGAAVTEIAVRRGELFGRQFG